eukprot:m.85735 g.85735  ORF g.85735 m.85735 type:complete len:159 (+) comp14850_c0_seq1:800-1276(+)
MPNHETAARAIRLPFPDAGGNFLARSAPARVPDTLRCPPGIAGSLGKSPSPPPMPVMDLSRARRATFSHGDAMRHPLTFSNSNNRLNVSHEGSLCSSPVEEEMEIFGEWPPLSCCVEYDASSPGKKKPQSSRRSSRQSRRRPVSEPTIRAQVSSQPKQ